MKGSGFEMRPEMGLLPSKTASGRRNRTFVAIVQTESQEDEGLHGHTKATAQKTWQTKLAHIAKGHTS